MLGFVTEGETTVEVLAEDVEVCCHGEAGVTRESEGPGEAKGLVKELEVAGTVGPEANETLKASEAGLFVP